MSALPENLEIPPEWHEPDYSRMGGTVFLLGRSGSGKSTFARWLAIRLAQKGSSVFLLDADIGQSSLGVPTTLNLARCHSRGEFVKERSFFAGSTSPRGHMLPVVVGSARLQEAARSGEASAIVVDTTGLVDRSAGGGALKEWKIALLRPNVVFAFQQERELEHLLGPLRRTCGIDLHIFSPPSPVRTRSPEERASRRRELFAGHFSTARSISLPLNPLPVHGLEKAAPGRLLSLADLEGFSLGLGVLLRMDSGRIEILTPVGDIDRVKALHLGDLRLNPESGEELS